MKITKKQLKEIIKEELEAAMDEGYYTRRGGSKLSGALHDSPYQQRQKRRKEAAREGLREIEGMYRHYEKNCKEQNEDCDEFKMYQKMVDNYRRTLGMNVGGVDPLGRGVQRYPEQD